MRVLSVCNYPSVARPAHQVFVRALLRALTAHDVDVTVLAPQSIWNLVKSWRHFTPAPRSATCQEIRVHRPTYVTYSNVRLPWGGNTFRWSVRGHTKSALREISKLAGPFDLCFAHFLYPHGSTAARVSDALGIPAVLSLGESSFQRYERTFSRSQISCLLPAFSKVIVNSSVIKQHCVEHFGAPNDTVHVLPNGVDDQHFYPRDRRLARDHCQLPQDRFIVISVGQFSERKGPLRLLEAIRPHPEIGAVFLGYGPQTPSGPQVLFRGAVPHEDVPIWLSAADAFVLPTLAEGCSNAVLEALFCGLPVVSSDLPFNHDILDDHNAILIEPMDISAIEDAILSLADDPVLRQAMRAAALRKAQTYRLADRAERIHSLLRSCMAPQLRQQSLART